MNFDVLFCSDLFGHQYRKWTISTGASIPLTTTSSFKIYHMKVIEDKLYQYDFVTFFLMDILLLFLAIVFHAFFFPFFFIFAFFRVRPNTLFIWKGQRNHLVQSFPVSLYNFCSGTGNMVVVGEQDRWQIYDFDGILLKNWKGFFFVFFFVWTFFF